MVSRSPAPVTAVSFHCHASVDAATGPPADHGLRSRRQRSPAQARASRHGGCVEPGAAVLCGAEDGRAAAAARPEGARQQGARCAFGVPSAVAGCSRRLLLTWRAIPSQGLGYGIIVGSTLVKVPQVRAPHTSHARLSPAGCRCLAGPPTTTSAQLPRPASPAAPPAAAAPPRSRAHRRSVASGLAQRRPPPPTPPPVAPRQLGPPPERPHRACLHAQRAPHLCTPHPAPHPQISNVLRAKSADGLSAASFELESWGLLVHAAYGFVNRLPFSSYGEAGILLAQNLLLLALVYRYARTPVARAGGVLGVFAAAIAALASGACRARERRAGRAAWAAHGVARQHKGAGAQQRRGTWAVAAAAAAGAAVCAACARPRRGCVPAHRAFTAHAPAPYPPRSRPAPLATGRPRHPARGRGAVRREQPGDARRAGAPDHQELHRKVHGAAEPDHVWGQHRGLRRAHFHDAAGRRGLRDAARLHARCAAQQAGWRRPQLAHACSDWAQPSRRCHCRSKGGGWAAAALWGCGALCVWGGHAPEGCVPPHPPVPTVVAHANTARTPGC